MGNRRMQLAKSEMLLAVCVLAQAASVRGLPQNPAENSLECESDLHSQIQVRVRAVGSPDTSPETLPYTPETLNWWNLPVQRSQEQIQRCEDKLTDKFDLAGLKYGMIPGKEAPQLAYECTKVPGIIEKIPEPLRGVFWMKGNIMSEELAVAQFAQWFPEQRRLMVPLSPFSWAWAGVDGTKPTTAPFITYNKPVARYAMTGLANPHTAFRFDFSECPKGWRYGPFGTPGAWCATGSGNPPELTYAEIAGSGFGNFTEKAEPGIYTFEQFPGEPNHWKRGIFNNIGPIPCGNCSNILSYDSVRILDGDGKPVEPWYSQYIEYIGEANLAFWYSYTDPHCFELLKEEKITEGRECFR